VFADGNGWTLDQHHSIEFYVHLILLLLLQLTVAVVVVVVVVVDDVVDRSRRNWNYCNSFDWWWVGVLCHCHPPLDEYLLPMIHHLIHHLVVLRVNSFDGFVVVYSCCCLGLDMMLFYVSWHWPL